MLLTDEKIKLFLHRKLLCRSIAGNRCDMLTIFERSEHVSETTKRPSIIISGRVHPGEANASYVIHGILEFLTSEDPDAKLLRKVFIFKIIPMLNPDGVIHGNYRCSLSGSDLNRCYSETYPTVHPTITALKSVLKATTSRRHVLLYLDLHGHSKKKNVFMYGCDVTKQPPDFVYERHKILNEEESTRHRIFSRIYPKLMSLISDVAEKNGYFSYNDCSFTIGRDKIGTGRVVSWRDLCIEASYTVEVSFCGKGQNNETSLFKYYEDNFTVMNQVMGFHRLYHSSYQNNNDLNMKNDRENTKDLLISQQSGSNSSLNSSSSKGSRSSQQYSSRQKNDASTMSSKGGRYRRRKSVDGTKPDIDEVKVLKFRQLLETYETAHHFTKEDLKRIGKDLCLGFLAYTNITNDAHCLSLTKSFYSFYHRNKVASSSTDSLSLTQSIAIPPSLGSDGSQKQPSLTNLGLPIIEVDEHDDGDDKDDEFASEAFVAHGMNGTEDDDDDDDNDVDEVGDDDDDEGSVRLENKVNDVKKTAVSSKEENRNENITFERDDSVISNISENDAIQAYKEYFNRNKDTGEKGDLKGLIPCAIKLLEGDMLRYPVLDDCVYSDQALNSVFHTHPLPQTMNEVIKLYGPRLACELEIRRKIRALKVLLSNGNDGNKKDERIANAFINIFSDDNNPFATTTFDPIVVSKREKLALNNGMVSMGFSTSPKGSQKDPTLTGSKGLKALLDSVSEHGSDAEDSGSESDPELDIMPMKTIKALAKKANHSSRRLLKNILSAGQKINTVAVKATQKFLHDIKLKRDAKQMMEVEAANARVAAAAGNVSSILSQYFIGITFFLINSYGESSKITTEEAIVNSDANNEAKISCV
jgi:hypothetical protein